MPTALYARKSTESDERQIQSLDDQIGAFAALCAREGLTIDETIVESKSARVPGARPEFERMMAMIEAGKIDALFTWSVNRLARNPVDGGRIQYLLQQGKLKFIRTVTTTYLPGDSALLLAIETGSATDYVRNLSRDVRRGMESKARAGWQAGRAPIGYLNNLLTHEIDVDPVRFPILRKGWEMLLTGGYTVQDVHRELLRLGLTSATGKAKGRPVSPTFLYAAFANPFYAGQLAFRGERSKGRHVPMVTEEEFERVQFLLGKPLKRRVRKHDFAFTGLLRCGACGCQIVADRKVKRYRKTRREVAYVYYHCTGARGCSKRGMPEEAIAAEFLKTFDRISLPEPFVQWAKDELVRRATEEAGRLVDADALSHQSAERERARLSRLGDMLLDGDIELQDYEAKKAEIKSRIEGIEIGRTQLRAREDRAHAIFDERLSTAARAASYGQYESAGRRAMARSLGAEHFLTLERLDIRLGPVMQKIAGFEPLISGYERPKHDDPMLYFSIWQGYLEAILEAAREEADMEIEREATLAKEQRTGKRPDRRRPTRRNRPSESAQAS